MQVFTLKEDHWFGKKGQKFIKKQNHKNRKPMCWIIKGGGLETNGLKRICAFKEWGDIS